MFCIIGGEKEETIIVQHSHILRHNTIVDSSPTHLAPYNVIHDKLNLQHDKASDFRKTQENV